MDKNWILFLGYPLLTTDYYRSLHLKVPKGQLAGNLKEFVCSVAVCQALPILKFMQHSQQSCKECGITSSLQMKKLRLGEVKSIIQGRPALEVTEPGCDANPRVSLPPTPSAACESTSTLCTCVAHHSPSLDFIKETPVPGKQAAASTPDSAKCDPSPRLHLRGVTQTPGVALPSFVREDTHSGFSDLSSPLSCS